MELLYPLVQLQLLNLRWIDRYAVVSGEKACGTVQQQQILSLFSLDSSFRFITSSFASFSSLSFIKSSALIFLYLLYIQININNGGLFRNRIWIRCSLFIKIWFIPFEVQEHNDIFSFFRTVMVSRFSLSLFFLFTLCKHVMVFGSFLLYLEFFFQSQIKWINILNFGLWLIFFSSIPLFSVKVVSIRSVVNLKKS